MKKLLQSYSSSKSLKKSSSKSSLKRQNSSPYLQIDSKIKPKSPMRKNKSLDRIKLKHDNISFVATRKKPGTNFESIKKSTGDLFAQMSYFKK